MSRLLCPRCRRPGILANFLASKGRCKARCGHCGWTGAEKDCPIMGSDPANLIKPRKYR